MVNRFATGRQTPSDIEIMKPEIFSQVTWTYHELLKEKPHIVIDGRQDLKFMQRQVDQHLHQLQLA